ncbi:MAG TPA: PilZ domain-containing protein [Novosphingobium sp.]|nr:PilZ domain-containing protein [Novosphingobium sp.]
MARHISSEGCQFVVEQDDIAEGQRFSFALEGHPAVRGTVRWVVNDRVGFAFDRPISRDTQAAMQQRCRIVQGVDLYLS